MITLVGWTSSYLPTVSVFRWPGLTGLVSLDRPWTSLGVSSSTGFGRWSSNTRGGFGPIRRRFIRGSCELE